MTYITKNLQENIVYWGSPLDDGHGGNIYSTPIQIIGRWEDRTEIVMNKHGEQKVCKSTVYVDRALDENGYIIRGNLEDYLDKNPVECNAQLIFKFEEIPNLRNTQISARAKT